MLSIAVCDSEKTELDITAACAGEWLRLKREKLSQLESFEDPLGLVERLDCGKKYNIYILEMNTKGIDGVAVGKIIRRKDPDAPIIYVTRSTEHAMDAYKLCACRYLLKPLRYAEIMSALDFALLILNGLPKKPFMIKNGGVTTSVDSSDIMYIENNVRIMKYYMCDGAVLTSMRRNISFEQSLSSLLAGGSFIQPHKSFVVNMKYISSLKNDALLLENGTIIPISRKHISEVREAYGKYVSGDTSDSEKDIDN